MNDLKLKRLLFFGDSLFPILSFSENELKKQRNTKKHE